MRNLPAFLRPKRLGAGLLLLLLALGLGAPVVRADPPAPGNDPTGGPGGQPPTGPSTDTSVGYSSIVIGHPPSREYSFLSGMTSGTVVVIPFAFDSVGPTYTLTNANLLLVSGNGTADRADLSLQVFSALPTSLALPSALTTLASPGGLVPNRLGVSLFYPDSTPTFTAGTTYYLSVTYRGTENLDWDRTSGDLYGYSYTAENPVTAAYIEGTPLVYHVITAAGVSSFYDNMGGFSITATPVTASAIPEPAATAALVAGAILVAALRLRRRRTCE